MLPNSVPNALTVDVEDYFQVSGFEHRVQRSDWSSFSSRVVPNTERLLALFDEYQVKGTFFVLGWVAERFPKLVRDIAAQGHELASHGYWHQLVYRLTPDEFRDDIRKSKKTIEDASGVKVRAYRAPSFSIVAKSLWALDFLSEEGFTLDSSIFPIRHDRYGIPNARHDIHQRATSSGEITEFPPTVWQTLGSKISVGGGYFRLFPLSLTVAAINAVRKQGRPAMFYIHPWEIDPDQPRISAVGWKSRTRHYIGLAKTERKLRSLLQQVRFGTISEVLDGLRNEQSCQQSGHVGVA